MPMLYTSEVRTHPTKGSFVMAVARVLGGVLLAATLLFAGLLFAFNRHFHPVEPKADYPTPKSLLEAQRQDLDYFTKVMALDRAFSPAARAAAGTRLRELSALPQALPSQKLQVALMQVMALADNGHQRVNMDGNETRRRGGNTPIGRHSTAEGTGERLDGLSRPQRRR